MRRIVLLTLTVSLLALPGLAEAHHRPTNYCSPTGDICQSTTKVDGIRWLRISLFAKYFNRYKLCVKAPDGSRSVAASISELKGRLSARRSAGAAISRRRVPVLTW